MLLSGAAQIGSEAGLSSHLAALRRPTPAGSRSRSRRSSKEGRRGALSTELSTSSSSSLTVSSRRTTGTASTRRSIGWRRKAPIAATTVAAVADAVVDEDGRRAGWKLERLAVAEELLAVARCSTRCSAVSRDTCARQASLLSAVAGCQIGLAALSNGADGEIGILRGAQLAGDDDVERRARAHGRSPPPARRRRVAGRARTARCACR